MFFHVLAGTWILTILLLAYNQPTRYRMLLQEDRIVEWGTVWLFAAAGVRGALTALGRRGVFDGLVALFCLFVAGEELSWGQRLLGYYPPEFFLANNFQQEFNLHNLSQWLVQPKWILMLALLGYGVLLPAAARLGAANFLVRRSGAAAPPLTLVPWFGVAILLLLWYPVTLTGEWVELLAGALFLVSTPAPAVFLWGNVVAAFVFGVAMTGITGAVERARDTARLPCARAEVDSLLNEVVSGPAATSNLWRYRRVHKRMWTAVLEGYVRPDRIGRFAGVSCAGAAAQSLAVRRKYAVDPWGSPYWVLAERLHPMGRRVTVYSFGPNRRRDGPVAGSENAVAGDDVVASITR